MISPALTNALAQWLDHQRALAGAAENTVKAYQTDLLSFLSFMTRHNGATQGLGPIARIGVRDMRSWMAHERGRGRWPGPFRRSNPSTAGWPSGKGSNPPLSCRPARRNSSANCHVRSPKRRPPT